MQVVQDPREDNKIDFLPKGLSVLHGFKATFESVPHRYHFNQWYHRAVHVLPRELDWVRKYHSAYENGILYECKYAGKTDIYAPFVIPEYVKVLPTTRSIVVLYTGEVQIDG